MDISDIGNLSSIIGLIISILTLIIAYIVKNEVKRIQFSNLFDKRINKHLKDIDDLQKELINIIDDVQVNEIKIKEILISELVVFESLLPKLPDKLAKQKTKSIIMQINNLKNYTFYELNEDNKSIWNNIITLYNKWIFKMIPERKILNLYIAINENYNRIIQVKLDKKDKII